MWISSKIVPLGTDWFASDHSPLACFRPARAYWRLGRSLALPVLDHARRSSRHLPERFQQRLGLLRSRQRDLTVNDEKRHAVDTMRP